MSAYRYNRLRDEGEGEEGEGEGEGPRDGGDERRDGGGGGGGGEGKGPRYYYNSRGRLKRADRSGLDVILTGLFTFGWVLVTISVFVLDRSHPHHDGGGGGDNPHAVASVVQGVIGLLGENGSSDNISGISIGGNGGAAADPPLHCFDGGISAMRATMLSVCLANLATYLFKLTVFFQFVVASVKEYAALHSDGAIMSTAAGLREDTLEHMQRARWVALALVRIALFPMALAHLAAAATLQRMNPHMRAYASATESDPSQRSFCFRVYLFYTLVCGQACVSLFAGILAVIKTVSGVDDKSTRRQIRNRLENQNITRILNELV
ncbi:hypothetical protein KHV-MN_00090 [Cyprinid herpesvirus 3]|uniref:M82 protein n=1 Tax=Cyprinid herpesvirus 3 TaxID=180230 RepID=C7EP43_CYHV3|nr:M82 protein [Cyprinid herpesvirus 3]AIC32437.1 ORF82L [Cyprinid herpesvirus 3]AVL28012.1 membrane protein ORF82 [Cyprinid herpesvirus 3]QQZ02169.1 hypothetical protein KHV-MN_00090 [Cyprinid herpesvirus 3]